MFGNTPSRSEFRKYSAYDSELVAPEARHDVAFANATADPLGGLLQQLVTGGVAEAVVDRA